MKLFDVVLLLVIGACVGGIATTYAVEAMLREGSMCPPVMEYRHDAEDLEPAEPEEPLGLVVSR